MFDLLSRKQAKIHSNTPVETKVVARLGRPDFWAAQPRRLSTHVGSPVKRYVSK